MIKRLSTVVAVFFLLTAFLTPAFAETYSAADAIADALHHGYKDKNINGDPINYVTTTAISDITNKNGISYGFLTYGQPHGELRNGHHRYIGYTYYGEDYTNMDFPADQYANGDDFASQDWISQPWKNQAVILSNPNITRFPDDGTNKYSYNIFAGLLTNDLVNNNGYINNNFDSEFWSNVEQYVHILAPPTKYAWGIGRMWHYKNGNLLYITVPIMPNSLLTNLDLEVTTLESGIPQGEKAQPGQAYTGTVVYKNLSDITMSKPAAVAVTNNGYATTLKDQSGNTVTTLILPPGESKTLTFTWHMPTNTNTSTLEAIINLPPDSALIEENLLNNKKTTTITANQKNLAVTITSYPDEAQPGQTVTVAGKITNESDTPITTLVQWYLGSKKVFEDTVTIDKTKNLNIPFTMPDSSTLVTVQVNPGHNQPPDEATWDDNKDSATINLIAPTPPAETQTGSGLTFQAVSQYSVVTGKPDTGKSIREPNTARWTDTVTAYLRPLKIRTKVTNGAVDYATTVAPPKPDRESECGSASYNKLDDYSITATLIYPKQNTRYTFGDPVPPVGTDQYYEFKNKLPPSGSTLTTELTWNNQEQAAVGQFKEMWAENGIRVQSIMHPELNSWIQKPQEYMLTATNINVTVKYTTHYNIRHCTEDG